jgi:surface-anchored protein
MRNSILNSFSPASVGQLGLAALLAAALNLNAQTVLTNGHTDVGIVYEDDAWNLHVGQHEADPPAEYAPREAVLQVGLAARATVPANPAFAFLGAAGAPVCILPQVENPALLFLGFGTEELPSGLFLNNQVRLTLRAVRGPGQFAVYDVDAFGTPNVLMNSGDGITAADSVILQAGGHRHVNWAFTSPGTYQVDLEAAGTLVTSNHFTTSGPVTYTFDVVPRCFQFTQEHVDLLSFQWNSSRNQLSLMASDDTHGLLYASNECTVLCPESMKFTLPAGTPLGSEGDPLWILPQNPYPGVPYVGMSAEAIGAGIFNDPLTIQLKRVEGPGHLIVWQSTTLGEFDIKMDTRDGIGPNDKLTPFIGGHEHHNWGFTTSGIYRVYFQASGVRVGQTTNTYSAETPFTLYVLPLKPFETWQATNWPCECRSNIIAASANPDFDAAVSAMEYALGTNPKFITSEGWPTGSIVTTNAQQYGALTFTSVKAATDCLYEVVAASSLTATNWQVLTDVFSVEDHGTTEQVTMRDSQPSNASAQRFYRLRVRLR